MRSRLSYRIDFPFSTEAHGFFVSCLHQYYQPFRKSNPHLFVLNLIAYAQAVIRAERMITKWIFRPFK